jgi:hypothetical protein
MMQRVCQSASRVTVVVGVMLTTCGLTLGDDKQSKSRAPSESTLEKVSGVITKVEATSGGAKGARQAWRLTINTDVGWRDFVRDQAAAPKKAAKTETAKAAAKGRKSVATEGHPQVSQSLVTVDVDPQAVITMSYRSSTDAIGEGSATPEGAGKAETASDKSSNRNASVKSDRPGVRRQALKARKLDLKELRPGLWVDVEFRHGDKENQARRVIVLRPVGGPDTSPDKEQPTASPGSKPNQ